MWSTISVRNKKVSNNIYQVIHIATLKDINIIYINILSLEIFIVV
jgi:hypothetical protein